MNEMKKETGAAENLKDRKLMYFGQCGISEHMYVCVTDEKKPVYLLHRMDMDWPENTYLVGEVLIYVDRGMILVRKISCEDEFEGLMKDTLNRIGDFIELDEDLLYDQKWKITILPDEIDLDFE